ncbi:MULTISPECIES: hypothetical protein [unclassified Pseudomonas]|uniref:hypothetical protein n=1 Tax=unclassified Pseudomonas TaxID=196821 RepID=UPI000C88C43F|nr:MULTISPECIES: hypothetical protein [unclassified Pseudomonas]PMX29254.1 hypothetical protein C1Y23_01520 [Pseudomonas sp. GW460-12]PMX36889.1 hypothetical protein C1Y24_04400 [Pseudomonas sp. MPR-R2A4]PMX43285.1 hypothetical protein C1Y26_03270 [Pseudomonas sp. MPR-R2A7]PMX53314.1 hypothetical protein C1Y17_14215 [Pseudomonas sp. MPR-R2A6]PMX93410.1 hypothetical protein C1Y21_02815 [Pseudomonas sp. MPR-R2A3]
MNATHALPKTIAQQIAARAEVIRIAEPYMGRMLTILSLTMPTMTMTRHEGHVSIETSYPPEVQGALDRIQVMCSEAVRRYLEREGFVYGSMYGGDLKSHGAYDIHD